MTSMRLPLEGRYVPPESDPYGLGTRVAVGLLAGAFAMSCEAHGEFACHSAGCRPPTSGGTGGSLPAGARSGFAAGVRETIRTSTELQGLALLGSVNARTEREVRLVGETVLEEMAIRVKARLDPAAIEAKRVEYHQRLADALGVDRERIAVSVSGRVTVDETGIAVHPQYKGTPELEKFNKEMRKIEAEDPDFTTYDSVYLFRKEQILHGEVLMEVMKEVRDFGTEVRNTDMNIAVTDEASNSMYVGKESIELAVRSAIDMYPTDWIEISAKSGRVDIGYAQRAVYNKVESKIGLSSLSVTDARHELAHRMETVIPGVIGLEREFIKRRTGGADPVPLSTLDPTAGYGPKEKASPDDFFTPYVGKDYNGRAFEVLSTGMECLMGHVGRSGKRVMDPDHQAFVIGTLLCARPQQTKKGST